MFTLLFIVSLFGIVCMTGVVTWKVVMNGEDLIEVIAELYVTISLTRQYWESFSLKVKTLRDERIKTTFSDNGTEPIEVFRPIVTLVGGGIDLQPLNNAAQHLDVVEVPHLDVVEVPHLDAAVSIAPQPDVADNSVDTRSHLSNSQFPKLTFSEIVDNVAPHPDSEAARSDPTRRKTLKVAKFVQFHQGNASNRLKCTFCGENGHTKWKCDVLAKVQCLVCYGRGHTAKNCKNC